MSLADVRAVDVDSARRRRAITTTIIAVSVAAAFLLSLWGLGAPRTVVFAVLNDVALAAPGVWLVWTWCVRRGWLLPLTVGPIVGFGASNLVLLVLWGLGARGVWLLAAAPIVASAAGILGKHLAGRVRLPVPHRRDAICLLLLLLTVPLVVARPFSRVGAETEAGDQVYRAYFTADYVWRRAVVTELAKGDFLPSNPFYAGDTLHYYWLPHLANAVAYRAAGSWVRFDTLLLTHSIAAGVCFVAFLFGACRWLGASPIGSAIGVACALLFTSFEGAYALWEHLRVGASLELLRYLNVDALSRWWLQGMPIDGLHRVLLYQPHHALGYALGFLGVLVLARRTRQSDPGMFAVGGVLLGLSLLTSSFGGLMFTAIAALYEGVSVLRQRRWRDIAPHALAAAAPLAVAAGIVVILEYVDRGGQVIMIGLNPVATHNLWTASLLSIGPAALLGGVGGLVAWYRHRAPLLVIAAVVVVCVFFYFLVDIRDHQNVYVGWRVGHLLFMSLAPLVATLWDEVLGRTGSFRALSMAGMAVVVVVASPTVLIDLYNTQDVANTRMGPGFRWTLLLDRDEQEALSWVKSNVPLNAKVQIDPLPRGADTWAHIPAFGERRLGVGLPISMVPLTKYENGTAAIHDMFKLPPQDLHDVATKWGIGYLYIARPERTTHAGLQRQLHSRPDLFPVVFRNAGVEIVQIAERHGSD